MVTIDELGTFFFLAPHLDPPLRTMVLRLSKERDEIYVDANEGFFKIVFLGCEAPSGLRRVSNRWCLGTGLGITDTMGVPFLRCEHLFSISARHFSVVLHIETRVTCFLWRSVCLSVCRTETVNCECIAY